MVKRQIKIGQIFRQAESYAISWEVVGLTKDAKGIVHARLVKSKDPTVVKLISENALLDRDLDQPL